MRALHDHGINHVTTLDRTRAPHLVRLHLLFTAASSTLACAGLFVGAVAAGGYDLGAAMGLFSSLAFWTWVGLETDPA